MKLAHNINNLKYVDETVLTAENESSLHKLMTNVITDSSKRGTVKKSSKTGKTAVKEEYHQDWN